MAEVRLEHIGKTYKEGTQAVKNISCTIKDKEFVVLVGPSGCGKTTTLRMIAGLEEITDGELSIGNVVVNDLPPNERQIAMVFQNYALYPHMTAYQNMAFGLKIKKVSKAQIHEQVMRAAEILNIEDILQKKPGNMSGGQRQRIAIGRAIVRDPDVFLFDEPLSNLDAKLRGKMRIELAKLHKKLDATIVYVTHDQVEAMTLGDQIIVMNEGEIMQMASPMELFLRPLNKFVAEFIGTPQMNMINGLLTEENGTLLFTNSDVMFDLSSLKALDWRDHIGRHVHLGIRSEDIYPHQGSLKNFAVMNRHVISVELLGNEKLIYSTFDGRDLIARFHSEVEVDVNSNIDFYLDLDKAHFFDEATGLRMN
jgi:multiple sugar transport system ATP-binding protein